MSYLSEHWLNKRNKEENKDEAFLIDDQEDDSNLKDNYVKNAKVGTIVAFRLNFEAKSGAKLTKVISGKIKQNNIDKEFYLIETRNGLEYGAPYKSIVWVKTGDRWPRGVYEEMKQGAKTIEELDENAYIEMGNFEIDETE